MFHKIVAALTALNLLWSVVATTGSAWAAEASAVEETVVEKEKPPRMMRTIMGMDDGTWAVVDVRKVKGNLVVLSPVVGPEIDLEESNRFALFQGRTVFNEKIKIGLFNMAVPGFQSAVFFLGRNDRPMVRVRFRSGAEIQSRTMPLKDKEELRRPRVHVEHFDDIQKKE
ncbi:MAG: hypothetical protein O2954_20050, partial [bacterium]|nr:hypothetical protein [bacterium]